MFPILLDLSKLKILLVGNGGAAVRRLKLLDEGGAKMVSVFADNPLPELKKSAGERLKSRLPEKKDFSGISAVMIAGMPEKITEDIAGRARKLGILVNVEDDKKYCDYHVPAIVRRGDFLLTVSTAGKSPRLSLRVRQEVEKLFPAKWEEKLNELELLRNKWRKKGDKMKTVARKTDKWLEENSLLKNICNHKKR
jgi:precorrin-2 dehydrogenase / sirohydrochlorin ferrochelatase